MLVEFGRAVLQAAPTGYSAIVLPDGDVLARTEIGAAAQLRERVPLRAELTAFARTGDLSMIALAFLAVSLAALRSHAAGRDAQAPGGRERRAPAGERSLRRRPWCRA